MRFLVDENIGHSIMRYLRAEGHDAALVTDRGFGVADEEILKRAYRERRILLTYDQDFGELVFLKRQKHAGVILLRLRVDNVAYHREALKNFLERHRPRDIRNNFWTVDERFLSKGT